MGSKPTPKTKRCPRCEETKPLSSFPKRGKTAKGTQRYGFCKPCHTDYQREHKLRTVFNLTLDDYNVMLEYQEGRCGVCQRKPRPGGKRLSIDHNHKTGLIRGLVCWHCNRAIGLVNDDAERAAYLSKYLECPPAVEALNERVYGKTGRSDAKRTKKSLDSMRRERVVWTDAGRDIDER